MTMPRRSRRLCHSHARRKDGTSHRKKSCRLPGEVATVLREGQRNAAGERHIALMIEQALNADADVTREAEHAVWMFSAGRGGWLVAMRLTRKSFSFAITACATPTASMRSRRFNTRRIVGVDCSSRRDADEARKREALAAGVFERFPSDFSSTPMLRIHHFGFLRSMLKKARSNHSGRSITPPRQCNQASREAPVDQAAAESCSSVKRVTQSCQRQIIPNSLTLRAPGSVRHADDRNAFRVWRVVAGRHGRSS